MVFFGLVVFVMHRQNKRASEDANNKCALFGEVDHCVAWAKHRFHDL